MATYYSQIEIKCAMFIRYNIRSNGKPLYFKFSCGTNIGLIKAVIQLPMSDGYVFLHVEKTVDV